MLMDEWEASPFQPRPVWSGICLLNIKAWEQFIVKRQLIFENLTFSATTCLIWDLFVKYKSMRAVHCEKAINFRKPHHLHHIHHNTIMIFITSIVAIFVAFID